MPAGSIAAAELAARAVFNSNVAVTLTATQMVDSSILTSTPTASINFTTDIATNIVGALVGFQVGTWFDFTIINLAAATHIITLVAGTGVTLVGSVAIGPASSGTFRARVDSALAVTIFRI